MTEFVYYGADWYTPSKLYWQKVFAWAEEWGVKLTKVDLSGGLIDGIHIVPTMDVVVDGALKLRVTRWGPKTKINVREVLT